MLLRERGVGRLAAEGAQTGAETEERQSRSESGGLSAVDIPSASTENGGWMYSYDEGGAGNGTDSSTHASTSKGNTTTHPHRQPTPKRLTRILRP